MVHIKIKLRKKVTEIRNSKNASFYRMPLQSSMGKPAIPFVKEGDNILKYQLLANADGAFSTNIHAPISGTVIKLEQDDYILIQNDFKDLCIPKMPLLDLSNITKPVFLEHIKNFGIVGAGGAQFPTHIKYNNQKPIDTLVINAAECEPYLASDVALLHNQYEEIIKAALLVAKQIGAKRIVIGIEKENKHLKTVLEPAILHQPLPITIKWLENDYPQGGELQLIYSTTKIKIPKGALPADFGVIVSNVGTLWAIYQAFWLNIPFVERAVTICDDKSLQPEVYWAKIGMSIKDLIEQSAINLEDKNVFILGGPMMGKLIQDHDAIIQKGSGGIIKLKPKPKHANNCIQCGYCADSCPMQLMPMNFASININSPSKEQFRNMHLQDCINCGLCQYVCPSDVPLMDSIAIGKKILQHG